MHLLSSERSPPSRAFAEDRLCEVGRCLGGGRGELGI